MQFDVQDQVSAAQAISGGPTVSSDSIQKISAAQDISIGRRIAALVIPTVAAGSGTTFKVEVIQADDAALTSNVEVLATYSFLAAVAIKGAFLECPIPQGVMTRTYFGLRYTCTSGTTTVTVDAYFVPQDEIDKYKSFPKVVGSNA